MLPLIRPIVFAGLLATVTAAACASPDPGVSYNRDIRPILVEHCFSCHGADSASRQADLRLDRRDDAVEHGVIVPGDPDSSPLLDRVFSDDPEEVMPPPATKKLLSAEHKDLLRKWIAAGAVYEPHWSFIPPVKPPLPPVAHESWSQTEIDRFILASLEAAGLEPAPEADRRTLARRVALDLTGLPPDPAAVEAFVADPRPDAYEHFVDKLLTSPAWGEHRGRHWLDYARYADTHGIHFDNEREMWTFRQWVIEAFNANLPFDDFTTLQLAGDLIDLGPDASPDRRLAARIGSGFNRCNVTTNEGGIIDEEYIVLYARDRTETTSTVWMGLTAGCAVCHDHKFDPFSTKDFYSLSAFFNNTTQSARDGNVADTPPILPVPRPEDRPRFATLEADLAQAREEVATRRREARVAFEAFVAAATPKSIKAALPQDTPLVRLPAPLVAPGRLEVELLGKQCELPLAETTTAITGPDGAPAIGLQGKAAEIATAGDFEFDQPFSVGLWLRVPGIDSAYAVVARMDEPAQYRGWDVWVQGRRVAMHLSHAWPEDAFKVVAESQLPADVWTYVTLTYDGSGTAEGVQLYYDGTRQPLKIENNRFQKHTIRTQAPFTLGSRTPGSPAHGVGLTDLTIHGRAFSAAEVEGLAKAGALGRLAALPAEERLAAAAGLYDWWLASHDEASITATRRVAELDGQRAEILRRGSIAHVMQEKPDAPSASILDRGEYDRPKERVAADTPEVLPPFPADLPRNRLGLAYWLLRPEHPLTARVTVNRFWQEVFGTGLVRTAGDFGITGELPSHPELLDWLAVDFREHGWDVKRLFRQLVTTAAYRQSAVITPEKLAADRDNRLLSRGPRFRLDAEVIRDQALAASGLLVRRLGGPSVKPYQPDGIWAAVAMPESNTKKYVPGTGEDLYRRSLYWFWKRSAPPASLDIFNAPSREVCVVRRDRTNTPLQALVAMNDPQFVEAARTLADEAVAHSSDERVRLDFVSRRLLARPLEPVEHDLALATLADLAAAYRDDPAAAGQLVSVGESKPVSADVSTLAAWTMLVNQLMNLDEFLCK
jgi:hypothetical protein